MRGLFALLIMLNAGYFIWQYSLQESNEAHPPTALALPPNNSNKALILLGEVGSLTAKNTDTVARPAQPPAPATMPCYTIGPFITAPEVQRASVMLETEGLTAHPRTGGTLDNPEHWIDVGSDAAAPPAPVSEALWQSLISLFAGIQQRPRVCQ